MRKDSLKTQVRKQFPNLTEIAIDELVQQIEALLGKLNLRWQLVEVVTFSVVHNSITFLTKWEEVEVKLGEHGNTPYRRTRQFIASRAGSGGRVHPRNIH